VLLLGVLLPLAAGAQEEEAEVLIVEGDVVVSDSTHGSHEVIVVPRDTATCGQPFTFTYTTFAGGAHAQTIHPLEGFIIPGSGMEFNANWVTVTNPPATFTNNPSGTTAAGWLSGPFAEVSFLEPVSGLSLFFASPLAVTLEAYDAGGTWWGALNGDLRPSASALGGG
jgi:hypothetical protein